MFLAIFKSPYKIFLDDFTWFQRFVLLRATTSRFPWNNKNIYNFLIQLYLLPINGNYYLAKDEMGIKPSKKKTA